MVDLSLDLNPADIASPNYNDLLVKNGDLVLTKDANPLGTNNILQDLLQRMRFFLGEWFLDNTQGLPWYQQILVKNPVLSNIEAILMNSITGTPGVVQLTAFDMTPNFAQRTLSVSFKCITTSGIVVYSGPLNPTTPNSNTGGQ